MPTATIFSIPAYLPDTSSGESVVGYEVQSCAPTGGLPVFTGTWTAVTGSPFLSNVNIVDVAGTAATQYRARPVRQITVGSTVYTLDTPFSRPFQQDSLVYAASFTRALLPTLRFTYLNDNGVKQTNGTVLMETTGAGQGQWIFNGVSKQFPLQFVLNDDPLKIMDGNTYTLAYKTGGPTGTPVSLLPDVDYSVDTRGGTVTFKNAPLATDYARFDFRRCDFVNEDLLIALSGAVNALSSFGLNSYQLAYSYNLVTLNQPLKTPDLGEILCKLAIYLMREGQTESALRGSLAWRDGGSSVDPYPSRALEFLVQKLDVTETSLRRAINTYIRGTTLPKSRGEFDIFWDLTQLTPLIGGMFTSMPSYGTSGGAAGGMGVPFFPWYM